MQVNMQAWGCSFDDLANQVHTMMGEMGGRNYFRSHASETWSPRMNLYETEARYVVCVELAGTRRESIEVRAGEGVLHICGSRGKPIPPDQATAEVSVHLMEIDSGRFHRKLPLPTDVVSEKIGALYRQGYLWITLPRDPTSGKPANER